MNNENYKKLSYVEKNTLSNISVLLERSNCVERNTAFRGEILRIINESLQRETINDIRALLRS